MELIWKYLQNQFLIATKTSYKKAVKISNYHDADLRVKSQTEPLLVPVYERYHPLHRMLVGEYTSWKSAGGSQEGQTLNLEQMLDWAYGKMNNWDIRIQGTDVSFEKGTPKYMSIFNNGRKPFINSSIDDRINAYDTLAKNMLPYVELAVIMAEVQDVYRALDEARDAQLGAKGTVKANSGKVEAARIEAMTMQWRNLGFSMDAFWNNLPYVESMFDLQTLREGRQYLFTGTLNPDESKAVLTNTFISDDELRLKNDGAASIKFYLATTPGGTDSDAIEVLANTEAIVLVSQFGASNYGTHRHLTAVNTSAETATHYEVELL